MHNTMNLPPYERYPTITGDKVSLRQIFDADINDLIEISVYHAIRATSVQEAVVMQTRIDADYIEGNSIHWCIVDNVSDKIVGTCGYYRGFDNGAGELGCILLSKYRGQGFMTPAMLLAIDFGLNTMGLNRIWAATTRQNAKAIQLLKNLQFSKVADLEDDEIAFELSKK